MIYTVKNTVELGMRARTFDADGGDYGALVYSNTETGEIKKHRRCHHCNGLIETVEGGEIELITKMVKPPLTVILIPFSEGDAPMKMPLAELLEHRKAHPIPQERNCSDFLSGPLGQ